MINNFGICTNVDNNKFSGAIQSVNVMLNNRNIICFLLDGIHVSYMGIHIENFIFSYMGIHIYELIFSYMGIHI